MKGDKVRVLDTDFMREHLPHGIGSVGAVVQDTGWGSLLVEFAGDQGKPVHRRGRRKPWRCMMRREDVEDLVGYGLVLREPVVVASAVLREPVGWEARIPARWRGEAWLPVQMVAAAMDEGVEKVRRMAQGSGAIEIRGKTAFIHVGVLARSMR